MRNLLVCTISIRYCFVEQAIVDNVRYTHILKKQVYSDYATSYRRVILIFIENVVNEHKSRMPMLDCGHFRFV